MTDHLLYTLDSLLDEDFRQDWLLEHLLPTGAGMLFYGRRGIGKSLYATALSISILERARLFSQWQARGSGNILYVQADLPPVVQQDRIKRIARMFPWVKKENLYFYFPAYFDVTRMEDEEELSGMLQEVNPTFTVWDVLRNIHHMQEGVHVPGIVYGSTRLLFPLSAHFYIHHDKKWTRDRADGKLDPAEDFSGVGPWLDLVVSAWHLMEEGDQGSGKFTLETTKNNCGPETDRILLKRDPDTLLPVLRLPRVHEEMNHWRSVHDCNPRKLRKSEKKKLRRHLLSSFVGPTTLVEKLIEKL